MNFEWSKNWHETFGRSAQEIVDGWADGVDIVHEDPILDQRSTTKEELLATFAPYSNRDPDNGIGIHTFVANEYVGNAQSGVSHWTWTAEGCSEFLGIPTNGKTISTRGVTVNVFDESGKILREFSYWDAVSVYRQLGVVDSPSQ